MTCTRTGCHIWVEPYREFMYGDAFEVRPFRTRDENIINALDLRIKHSTAVLAGPRLPDYITNIAYFKLVAWSHRPINNLSVIHYTIHDFEEIISTVGEAVERDYQSLPALLITNNFTNHGYNGVSIDQLLPNT